MRFQSLVSLSCFASAIAAHYIPRQDDQPAATLTASHSKHKCGSKPSASSSAEGSHDHSSSYGAGGSYTVGPSGSVSYSASASGNSSYSVSYTIRPTGSVSYSASAGGNSSYSVAYTTHPTGSVSYSASASDNSSYSVPTISTSVSSVDVTTISSSYSATTSSGSSITTTSSSSYSTVTSSSSSSTTTSSSSSSTITSSSSSSTTTSSSTSTSSATATASACAYWLEDVKHQGIASFNDDAGNYVVFRNVKDYGAKGDGVTDDTDAINLAISEGGRCAPGTCASSTTTPALVYFPNGTYVVSGAIVGYYYTQIVGNPNCLPIIKASSDFAAAWVFDANEYGAAGLGWGATNVFWRQIRNFVVDMTDIPASKAVYGVHWAVSQATSLQNIVFQMSSASGTQHAGVFIEEGSGGFVTDLVFYGGLYGLNVGNQQFTMRNLTFHNAVTAIRQIWDWGWTYSGISINNCQIGLNMTDLKSDKTQDVGSVVFYDSEINNTPVGIWTARNASSTPSSGGSLILENISLNNVDVAIQGFNGDTILAGSSGPSTIAAWGQGHSYTATSGPTVFQDKIIGNSRPATLAPGGEYYARSKPQYENIPISQIVSIRAAGASGDGETDDTDAINTALLAAAAAGKVVFFDAGNYKVTNTIFIPAGSKISGEAFPVILSSGSFFEDIENPQPVVQVGQPGDAGVVEWTDTIVSTQGAQAGAILIQWNLASVGSPSGMWDVHTRIGGFAGSKLQVDECPKTPDTTINESNLNEQCIAAFQSLHVTKAATGLYIENCWFWVADHDVDDPSLTQITVYAGRGLLIESTLGNVWLIGTGVEHHVLYEYQLVNTKNVVLGQIQTETAYYQPNPAATIPFPAVESLYDPILADGQDGWGLRVVDSSDVFVYGAGTYSFFDNYDVSCSDQDVEGKCQTRIVSIEDSSVSIYNLNTIGSTSMATVNGVDIASWADNRNNFVSTIAVLRT